jgi:hypothetical protein
MRRKAESVCESGKYHVGSQSSCLARSIAVVANKEPVTVADVAGRWVDLKFSFDSSLIQRCRKAGIRPFQN